MFGVRFGSAVALGIAAAFTILPCGPPAAGVAVLGTMGLAVGNTRAWVLVPAALGLIAVRSNGSPTIGSA